MRRVHLFEIHETAWCPPVVRDGLTDFLQIGLRAFGVLGRTAPVLARALARSGTRRVVDLCSGGSGPWLSLVGRLDGVDVVLTDLHPSAEVAPRVQGRGVRVHPAPVDAMHVPPSLDGFRTMFNAFHQFAPDDARAVLRDAVAHSRGIALFDVTHRSVWGLFLVSFLPLWAFLLTPFVRPWSWRRLLLTYLVPVIPFVIWFDGIVSCLRTYTPVELRQFADELEAPGWRWEAGTLWAQWLPVPVTYLVGVPPRD